MALAQTAHGGEEPSVTWDHAPLIKEISLGLTPPQAFECFYLRPFSFFLDSGMDPQRLGRYSFMGSDPFLVLVSRGREVKLLTDGGEEVVSGNPFDVLEELLRQYVVPPGSYPVPFVGGAVGYLSYDLCHFIERLPTTAVDDLGLPECYLAFYDAVVAFDHHDGKAYILSTGLPEQADGVARKRAQARIRELEELLTDAAVRQRDHQGPAHQPPASAMDEPFALSSNFTHQGYLNAVQRARAYIAAGDIFQVNLSQRFETRLSLHPYELYRRLRHINPAPFAAYLNLGGVVVVSASPERFLKLTGDRTETRPIKGTRPRGKTPAQDEALAQELVKSAKDRAEHIMIVDLERNDLGRVCRYGSVRVSELAALETYATVFHLTSTVEGRLRSGNGPIDLLRATFPGGSITGAPKVRAMEIIDELEPTKRSVYTGSIGYLGFDGSMDLNIAIRTILVKEGRAYLQVGGAVVYDSDPEAEYQETLDKARALVQALGMEI